MRNRKDSNTIVTKALAAANANADTDTIDLGTGSIPENVQLEVTVPATDELVAAKTIIVTVKDSADDSSFATVALLGSGTVTGTASVNGNAETKFVFALPPTIRRYVRVNAAVLADGGDVTDYDLTAALVY